MNKNMTGVNNKSDSKKSKNAVLTLAKRLVPGTVNILPCKMIEYCTLNGVSYCGDIKMLCLSCEDDDKKIIGGLSFIFGGVDGIDITKGKNGIAIHRYNQAGSYATAIEGNGIDEILEKFEKDETIKEITEKTKFIRDEEKEAEDLKKIEAFKRIDLGVLITKKKSDGGYEKLEEEFIRIAKQKEKNTGKKIKIIDESEIYNTVYTFCIVSKKLMKKLELDAKRIEDADGRILIQVVHIEKSGIYPNYVGILAISSVEDDVFETNDEKDKWRKYFTENYIELCFVEKIRLNPERNRE